MAQRQRVGFQTRRLGVQIPLASVVTVFFLLIFLVLSLSVSNTADTKTIVHT